MYILPQLKKMASLTLPCVHFSLLQAWEVNKETNCVITYLADCETQLSRAPRQGLLYGVPVSLKECFSYKVCPVSVSGLNFSPFLPASSVSWVRSRGLERAPWCALPWPMRGWWEWPLCC